jgi:alpha-D-ribose 1-methylphosphonate 5-triphosphate synthase subunit PhnL
MSARKATGTAFVGIFHDEEVRARVADRIIDVSAFAAREAA